MWRLTTCYDSEGHPFLRSTNGHQGRQVWVYDEDAGTDADRQEVERLREAFTDTRLKQKHSSDELLRLQKINKHQVSLSYMHMQVNLRHSLRACEHGSQLAHSGTIHDSASDPGH